MYRLAEQKDIERLCELRVKQQKEDWGSECPDNDENLFKITEKFLKKFLGNDFYIFVEEIEEEIVATCGFQIFHYLPQCNEKSGMYGYVCNVFTKREFRRQGISKKLLEEILDFAKEKKLDMVTISGDNPVAVTMYKKAGFVKNENVMKMKLD